MMMSLSSMAVWSELVTLKSRREALASACADVDESESAWYTSRRNWGADLVRCGWRWRARRAAARALSRARARDFRPRFSGARIRAGLSGSPNSSRISCSTFCRSRSVSVRCRTVWSKPLSTYSPEMQSTCGGLIATSTMTPGKGQ